MANYSVGSRCDFSCNKFKREPNPLDLEDYMQCICIGKSRSGKTNTVLSLLCKDKNDEAVIANDIIFICAPNISSSQSAYTNLQKIKEKDPDICGDIEIYDSINDMPTPPDLPIGEDDENVVVIFDDCVNEKDPGRKIDQYFTKGRHSHAKGGFDMFYLTQNYYGLPRGSVRNNSNTYMFFGDHGDPTLVPFWTDKVSGICDYKWFKSWFKAKNPEDKYIPNVVIPENAHPFRRGLDLI